MRTPGGGAAARLDTGGVERWELLGPLTFVSLQEFGVMNRWRLKRRERGRRESGGGRKRNAFAAAMWMVPWALASASGSFASDATDGLTVGTLIRCTSFGRPQA